MNTYEKYKDSGIEWLGQIPEHWKVVRFKDFSNIVRGGSPRPAGDSSLYEGDIPFLKVADLTSDKSIYLKKYNNTITELGLNFTRLVKKDTLLLTNSGATLGIPKICTFQTTFNDGIAAFLELKKSDKKYLFFLLFSMTKRFLNLAALGQGQPNLNTDIIGNSYISLPPLPEQTVIAKYLDEKTQAIDKKTELLQQKISYYKELRKSIINQAVTKGLNEKGELRSLSEVEMKDSGIDWIGQIPKHWEVKRVKDEFNTISGGTPSTKKNEYWQGNIPWIPSGNIQNNIVLKSSVSEYISQSALTESSTKLIKKNSLLIALTGATCSNIGYLTFDTTINQSIVAMLKMKSIKEKFYFYFLMSAKTKIRSLMTGGAQGGINQEDVKFFDIIVPPIQEQTAIANYLDEKTAQIDAIVSNIEQQITKLAELRKTLINDVVTGKIKVI